MASYMVVRKNHSDVPSRKEYTNLIHTDRGGNDSAGTERYLGKNRYSSTLFSRYGFDALVTLVPVLIVLTVKPTT